MLPVRSASRTRQMSTDSMLSDFSQLDDANANASYASDAFSDTYSQSDYSGRDDVGMSNSSSYLDLSSLSRSASRLSHTSLQSTQSEASKNFKVVIRVRPPLPRELQTFGPKKFVNIVEVTEDERGIVLSENAGAGDETVNGVYTKHAFTFDHVYGENRGQRDVYEQTAKDAVLSTLQGYNATIIAYGQTGTGKTYTMEGVHSDEEQRGIIPRSIEEIFRYIHNTASPTVRFLVRASYLQIYNEVISDLLKPERTNLTIREDKKRGVFVEGLSEWVVRSPAEIYGLMQRGAAVRATGATRMNEMSSRSHALFIIIVEQTETQAPPSASSPSQDGEDYVEKNQNFRVGKLNLVDLAGSERVRISGATGARLEESKQINKSLSALGNVISALTDSKGRQHIPYRDSRLTRILEDSLGGNCKTTMMAMISPALESFMESLSTLKFANRAKSIKNVARVNEDLDEKALLRRYERELLKLRQELAERRKNVVDKRKLLEVEEQRRRAEQDKLAAIIDLERLSRDLLQEKKEKRKLEARIREMNSQLLVGGVVDSQAFRSALAAEQSRIRKEYEEKLGALERERQSMEEDKAQVDRYKQLLLKQRDIMIQLTARLNERDQSILVLQEELDSYDKQQRLMEDALDQKTAMLIRLQKVAVELQQYPGVKEMLNGMGESEIESSSMFTPTNQNAGSVAQATPIATQGIAPNSNSGTSNNKRVHHDEHLSTAVSQEISAFVQNEVPALTAGGFMIGGSGASFDSAPSPLESAFREKMERLLQHELSLRNTHSGGNSHGSNHGHGNHGSNHSSPREEVERLKFELAKAQKALEFAQAGTATEVNTDDEHGSGKAAARRMKQLEDRLEQLRSSHSKFRQEVASRLKQKNDLVKRLEDENAQIRSLSGSSGASSPSPSLDDSVVKEKLSLLKGKYSEQLKERTALRTILESKMKTIIDDIAMTLGLQANPAGTPAAQDVKVPNRMRREVEVLQRLINASVLALKLSEEAAAQTPLDVDLDDSLNSSTMSSLSSVPASPVSASPLPPQLFSAADLNGSALSAPPSPLVGGGGGFPDELQLNALKR